MKQVDVSEQVKGRKPGVERLVGFRDRDRERDLVTGWGVRCDVGIVAGRELWIRMMVLQRFQPKNIAIYHSY